MIYSKVVNMYQVMYSFMIYEIYHTPGVCRYTYHGTPPLTKHNELSRMRVTTCHEPLAPLKIRQNRRQIKDPLIKYQCTVFTQNNR